MGEETKLVEPTEEFEVAFRQLASLVVQCEFCERTNFAIEPGRGFYDEGELDDLLDKECAAPDLYNGQPYCSIDWGYLNGKQFVAGCPCNLARPYEDFIWQHRDQIAKYFQLRAEKEHKEACRNIEIGKKAAGAMLDGKEHKGVPGG